MLWDTAGQEEFDAITKAYYRGEAAAAPPWEVTDLHGRGYASFVLRWKDDQLLSRVPGAQACVLVFSTTDRESFQSIDSWREKVEAEVGDIPTVLVQNKIDLLEETVVKKYVTVRALYSKVDNGRAAVKGVNVSGCSEEAEALAKRLKLRFYRASVKEDLNVTEGESAGSRRKRGRASNLSPAPPQFLSTWPRSTCNDSDSRRQRQRWSTPRAIK